MEGGAAVVGRWWHSDIRSRQRRTLSSLATLEVLARKHQIVSEQQLCILHDVLYTVPCRCEVLLNYKKMSHGSCIFFSTGCWLRETADNARHLLWSHTYFLPVEEAAVPACPLILSLCHRAGGLWTHGTCQTLPLYHCSCNGHTR